MPLAGIFGGACLILILLLGWKEYREDILIADKVAAEVEAGIAKNQIKYDQKLKEETNRLIKEFDLEIADKDKEIAQWEIRNAQSEATIERQRRLNPKAAGDDLDLFIRFIMCLGENESGDYSESDCIALREKAPPADKPITVTLTPELAEARQEACDDWRKLRPDSPDDDSQYYNVKTYEELYGPGSAAMGSDFCNYTITGFTAYGQRIFEDYMLQLVRRHNRLENIVDFQQEAFDPEKLEEKLNGEKG